MDNCKQSLVLITGAGSGIGEGLAYEYAALGWRVIVTGRNEQRLATVVEHIKQQGHRAEYYVLDVSRRDDVSRICREIEKTQPIDLMIANAGCSMNQVTTNETNMALAEAEMVDTHIHGMLNCVHAVLESMKQRASGQIVLMGSLNSFVVIPRSRIYGALKTAVLKYGLSLRQELLNTGVKVNVMCPGWVKSRLTDINSFPMPGMISADQAAKKIVRGIAKNQSIIAFPWLTAFLARVVGSVYYPLQVKIFATKNGVDRQPMDK